MEFKHKVEMALEDWQAYKEDTDISTALAHVIFLSTKPNTHKHIYTENVIKQYAPTYLGKFVVSGYSDFTMDSTTHVGDDMDIVGYIPTNQKVQYTKDEEGYFQAGVDVVVSKLYARDVYESFKKDGEKAVSVEQLVGFTEETEDLVDGIDEKVILGFEGVGICMLGDAYNPSIPTANIKLVTMSEVEYEAEYVKYSEIGIDKEEKMSEIKEILNKVTKIEEKLNKEETMAEINKITKYAVSIGDGLWSRIYKTLKEKYPIDDNGWITSEYMIKGIYEEGTEKFVIVEGKESGTEFKVSFTLTDDGFELSNELKKFKFVEESEMEMFTSEDFTKYEDSLNVKEDECSTKEEVKEETMGKKEEKIDEETMADVVVEDEKLSEANAKIEKYEAELADLRAFKTEAMQEKCNIEVKETLSIAKQIVTSEEYEALEKESKACTYEDVSNWSDKILASLTKRTITKMEEISSKGNEGILDLGIPKGNGQNKKKSTNIYD